MSIVGCFQNVSYTNPSPTPDSYTATSPCSPEKEMAIKSAIVGTLCFAIDKMVFGEDIGAAAKFGLIGGLSSGLADRAASYIPNMYGPDQASSFENVIKNNTTIGIVGGAGITVLLVNEKYGRVSQSKQALTVIFAELLATHIVKKFY